MSSNSLNARVSHMSDVEANWNKCPNFIPMRGELIVYEADDTTPYQRFKLGDGVTTVMNLPFTVNTVIENLLSLNDSVGYVDAGRITDYQ